MNESHNEITKMLSANNLVAENASPVQLKKKNSNLI